MNDIRIYHSEEFIRTKRKKLGKGKTYLRLLSTRVTLAYMIVKNAVYITAARCSETDQFSRKVGASLAGHRMKVGQYALVMQFNNLNDPKELMIRELLECVALGVARKEISIK